MYKIQIISVLAILLSVVDMQGQYYSERDTMTIDKKNSIGLYISPIVSFLMNSYANNPRYGLQYKRLIQNNKQLRLSLVYDQIKYQYRNNFPIEDNMVAISDSSFTIENESRNNRIATVRAGFEWSNYQKSYQGFFGLDIIAGYKDDLYHLEQLNYQTIQTTDGISFFRFDPTMNDLLYSYTYKFLILGVSPIIGWRFDIKNRLSYAISVSPEVTTAIPISSTWSGSSVFPLSSPPDTEIEFRLRVLEMVLSYRF